ncbi:c-type cytochrome [Elioraea thermophila]|uniref:c-type cytochrome n=1 Tax=Elioraea thermophila TaxID=2185104 RepID=UPI000DF1B9F9|nr:c-type cytochrome [Elioraea thermophila]
MRRFALVIVSLLLAAPAAADLRGHGGPVKAIAVSPDGSRVVSGSFDASAILWSPARHAAEAVLRGHDGAVNAIAFARDGRFATGGDDGRILLWRADGTGPERILTGHEAKVTALAVSPDGRLLVSSAWDRTVRLWHLEADAPARVLEGHADNAVNAVGWLPDGSAVVSAGYDGTLRLWPLDGSAPKPLAELGLPLNALAVLPDGTVAVAGAEGTVSLVARTGGVLRRLEGGAAPVITLAVDAAGNRLAAGGIRGSVAIWSLPDGRLLRTLSGPGLPVWAVAFAPDGVLWTGGTDRMVRRWDAETGVHLGAAGLAEVEVASDHPGARVFRACAACHTLKGDSANRAGPTLARLFGRRIATVPDYSYSEALRRMDIVWTRETVAALFTLGPSAYTPGTKMPEQVVGSREDLEALLDFLEIATGG